MRFVTALLLIIVGSAALLAWTVLEHVLVLRRMNREIEIAVEQGPFTVVWHDVEQMLMAYTGTIRPVGEWHIVVTDADGWPVVVDRRDIIEVYA